MGKDDVPGALEGKFGWNRLFANYTFTSEDKTTIREVAFLLSGIMATGGLGKMEAIIGMNGFKHRSNIDF